MIDQSILKSEEKAVFALRDLYRAYGYLPFRMSKFEEFEYYIRNKDFLVSDRIITFTDTNGRLLAMKPDVTLSILKHDEDAPGCKQKVCYNENVYRISGASKTYREILQCGLECIGDVGSYEKRGGADLCPGEEPNGDGRCACPISPAATLHSSRDAYADGWRGFCDGA